MVTENVHNYYESELKRLIAHDSRLKDKSRDFIEDVACLTLNQLPAFYVRFDVDTTFYMSEDEILSLQKRLKAALDQAVQKVEQNPHPDPEK